MVSDPSDSPCTEDMQSGGEGHSGCSGFYLTQVESTQRPELVLQVGQLDAIVQRMVARLQTSGPSSMAAQAQEGKKAQAKGLKRKARSPTSSSDSEDSRGPDPPKKGKRRQGKGLRGKKSKH